MERFSLALSASCREQNCISCPRLCRLYRHLTADAFHLARLFLHLRLSLLALGRGRIRGGTRGQREAFGARRLVSSSSKSGRDQFCWKQCDAAYVSTEYGVQGHISVRLLRARQITCIKSAEAPLASVYSVLDTVYKMYIASFPHTF